MSGNIRLQDIEQQATKAGQTTEDFLVTRVRELTTQIQPLYKNLQSRKLLRRISHGKILVHKTALEEEREALRTMLAQVREKAAIAPKPLQKIAPPPLPHTYSLTTKLKDLAHFSATLKTDDVIIIAAIKAVEISLALSHCGTNFTTCKENTLEFFEDIKDELSDANRHTVADTIAMLNTPENKSETDAYSTLSSKIDALKSEHSDPETEPGEMADLLERFFESKFHHEIAEIKCSTAAKYLSTNDADTLHQFLLSKK